VPLYIPQLPDAVLDVLLLLLEVLDGNPNEQKLLVQRALAQLVRVPQTDAIRVVAAAANSRVETAVLADEAAPLVVVVCLGVVALFYV